VDESIRRQVNWIVAAAVIVIVIVWAVGRSHRMADLQDRLANGTPAQQLAAAGELVDGRALADAMKDQPRWVQERAVAAVAQIGTAQAWYQLLTAWYLLDAPVQQRATDLLISAGNSAIPTLVEALRDKDANTRKGVNAVLIAIGEPVIPYLLPLMDAWDDYVRAGVSAVLGGVGEPAIDELIAVIKEPAPTGSEDPEAAEKYLRQRATAQAALQAMKAVAFPAIIGELLTDPNSDTRGVGVTLLGGSFSPEEVAIVVPSLLGRLQSDTSYAVRRKAAASIGVLGPDARDNGATAPLIARLQDPNEHPDVRAAVAEALGKLGDPAAAGPLVQALIGNREGIADELVRAIERLGAASVGPLAGAIADPSGQVQLLAVRALANIGGPAPVVPLAQALSKSADPAVRRAAAEALRARTDTQLIAHAATIIGPLTKALYDADWHVYYAARDALGKCGPAAIPALLQAMGSSDVRAAHMAQQALVRIGRPAVTSLVAAIKQAQTQTDLAKWAAIALGELGAYAVQPTAKVLSDQAQPAAVRRAAVNALGRTRSKDALPPLQTAYSRSEPAVAAAIMGAVGQIASGDGVDLLLKGLEASSPQVRDAAMTALSQWRASNPQPQLARLAEKTQDKDLQYRAAIALVLSGTSAGDTQAAEIGGVRETGLDQTLAGKIGQLLSQAAADEGAAPPVRHGAINALGTMGYTQGVEALSRLLKAGGEYAADAAQAVALIGMKAPVEEDKEAGEELSEAGKSLITVLTDPNNSDSIRVQAAVGLAMMQASPVKDLVGQLEAAPDDIKPWLAATLGGIGRYATDPVYDARMRAQDPDQRAWLAITMECIGDAKSLQALKQIPDNEKPDEDRRAAALRLTDKLRLLKKY